MDRTNNMEIWVVSGSSGSYDDYYAYNVKAFTSQQAAQDWVDMQPEVDYKDDFNGYRVDNFPITLEVV